MARGGMPGGFDVNALMKQAQQMQSEMLKAQEALKDEIVEASAGGGMVKVKMGGDLTLREIVIDPDAIDPEEADATRGQVGFELAGWFQFQPIWERISKDNPDIFA